MKKALLALNIVLIVGLVTLYILFFTAKSGGDKTVVTVTDTENIAREVTPVFGENLPIAFVNLDTLMLRYEFAVREQERLLLRERDVRARLSQEVRQFEEEHLNFQRKIEHNVFATRERAEAEANRLARRHEEIQRLELQLTEQLLTHQQQVNLQLRDSLNNALDLLNRDRNFHLIFSNTMSDNILLADNSYDITDDIVELLNSRIR